MEENPSRTLFLLIQQYKTPAIPETNLFLYFQQYKTAVVPYFSVLKRLKPQSYFILAYSIE